MNLPDSFRLHNSHRTIKLTHPASSLILAIFLFASPFAALASQVCPAGTATLFSCNIQSSGKQLQLCDTGSGVQYRFGPPDHPELVFTQPYQSLVVLQGLQPNYSFQRFQLHHGKWMYEVDYNGPGAPAPVTSMVNVSKQDSQNPKIFHEKTIERCTDSGYLNLNKANRINDKIADRLKIENAQ